MFGSLTEGIRYFTQYVPSPKSRVRAFVDAEACAEQILDATSAKRQPHTRLSATRCCHQADAAPRRGLVRQASAEDVINLIQERSAAVTTPAHLALVLRRQLVLAPEFHGVSCVGSARAKCRLAHSLRPGVTVAGAEIDSPGDPGGDTQMHGNGCGAWVETQGLRGETTLRHLRWVQSPGVGRCRLWPNSALEALRKEQVECIGVTAKVDMAFGIS